MIIRGEKESVVKKKFSTTDKEDLHRLKKSVVKKNKIMTQQQLEKHLWGAAKVLRGSD